MRTITNFVLLSATAGWSVCAQGVNIGSGGPPDPSAILEISGNTGGLLIPRLTEQERNAIQNPATGLVIYNLDTDCMNMWTGQSWKQYCGDCNTSLPVVTTNSPVCVGQPLQISATSIPGATYQWIGPNGYTSSSPNITIASASLSDGGMYILQVSQNGCLSMPLPVSVTVSPVPPSPVASVNSPCLGGTVQLSASSIPGATYQWSGPNGFSSALQNPTIPSASTSHNGLYTVTVNINGCQSSPDTAILNVGGFTGITFSNCGQTGRTGPSQTQCDNTYGAGVVTVTNGIQAWTPPQNGTYKIRVCGARGGNVSSYTGGRGICIEGDFQLNTTQTLMILVGQMGEDGSYNRGGGGGSFVWINGQTTEPLIAAGGGGGAGYSANGKDAVASSGGTTGSSGSGTPGSGGNGATPGGAGWKSDGGNHTGSTSCTASCPGGSNGVSYGGARPLTVPNLHGCPGTNQTGYGGFGGGSGGNGNCTSSYGGGGGGGYSGGAGQTGSSAGGGGGGSYNSGSNQSTIGYNTGHGYVTITLVCGP